MADDEQTAEGLAGDLQKACLARAHGMATLQLALQQLDLDEDQALVLDVGICTGIAAAVAELNERGYLQIQGSENEA